ncbi:hypothetical protein NC651_002092 [Populus alba x Populus x berolinensis]|nr:hypothetical protein NC651_002092 [Populus alba x Populus x berolinensis]
MVHIVLVRHALDTVPPATTNIRDIGCPVVASGSHDVIDRFLLTSISPSSILVHREPRLRPVHEGGLVARIRHDDRERLGEWLKEGGGGRKRDLRIQGDGQEICIYRGGPKRQVGAWSEKANYGVHEKGERREINA